MRITLAYLMSESEIAVEMGMSLAAVKTTLRRAFAKIRLHPKAYAKPRAAIEERPRTSDAHWILRARR